MSTPYANLKKPGPGDTVIRYTSLAQLVWIVAQRALPLVRVDRFRDPFEGSATKTLMDQATMLDGDLGSTMIMLDCDLDAYSPGGTPQDREKARAQRRRNLTYSTHASCWREGKESEGMWRLYCGEREGVAFKTTFAKLERSVDGSDVIAGKVQYIDYHTAAPFTAELDHVMFKRDGFAFEQEVRLLKYDHDHWTRLCSGATKDKMQECLPIPWELEATVECITVSPYAADWYIDAVRAAINGSGLKTRVEWSPLRAKPDF